MSSQISFLQLFNTFVRKSNVHTICLLLNRIDQDKQFQGWLTSKQYHQKFPKSSGFGYHFSSHHSSSTAIGGGDAPNDNDVQISTRSRHVAIKNESNVCYFTIYDIFNLINLSKAAFMTNIQPFCSFHPKGVMTIAIMQQSAHLFKRVSAEMAQIQAAVLEIRQWEGMCPLQMQIWPLNLLHPPETKFDICTIKTKNRLEMYK